MPRGIICHEINGVDFFAADSNGSRATSCKLMCDFLPSFHCQVGHNLANYAAHEVDMTGRIDFRMHKGGMSSTSFHSYLSCFPSFCGVRSPMQCSSVMSTTTTTTTTNCVLAPAPALAPAKLGCPAKRGSLNPRGRLFLGLSLRRS